MCGCVEYTSCHVSYLTALILSKLWVANDFKVTDNVTVMAGYDVLI